MAKTTTEKIELKKTEMAQLENELKRLMQQQKEQERKARTKRLIERGAILESLVPGADALTNDEIKAFLEKTVTNDYARRAMANVTAHSGGKPHETPSNAKPQGNAASVAEAREAAGRTEIAG
ncbi:MAG: DUF3847 domain-containing protein [Oscillospiraceae bacterium]|jgi:hypothetical protein|nr:DUF3847 domain-containing protein [Oscillospiraceae bacterium]